ncbi:MAG: DNA-directed RNA polymerase subunit A' [Candidatus Nanohalarchaeota archaeon]|nr:MAG: DNA-directed RNA polymerase subunit A' [Candidatus Nanohaloarchaeota archaeon]
MSGIKKIEFGLMSPSLIRKLAVMEITSPDVYDTDALPVDGGIMDLHLGVVDPGSRCKTCLGKIDTCTGHFGYISLAKPIVNVLYINYLKKILQLTCAKCGAILLDENDIKKIAANEEETFLTLKKVSGAKPCPVCGEEQEKIKLEKPHTFKKGKTIMNPEDIKEHLERISDEDLKKIGFNGGRPEWMIMTLFLIPPISSRPSIMLENGDRSEDDLTHKLVDIIRINERLKENVNIETPSFIIDDLWELLQYHITTYFNNELTNIPPARHKSGRLLKTLSSRLKTKEGRFRLNLTGKRVNFSSRGVISPDPLIHINEVGVPRSVAEELTIPEVVNEKNKNYMKDIIKNAGNYPTAQYVISDGVRKKVMESNADIIVEGLENGDIVERQMIDGDIVLFNRQPSLHRMSIMAHYAKIMPGNTFRLNLCVCKPYNADFDGDEMNLHLMQTAEARAEAKKLMLVEENMRSPKAGAPVMGCDQDYISGAYMLTKNSTILTKKEAARVLAAADIFVDLDKEKYTGKELVSFLIPKNISITYETDICSICELNEKANCKHDYNVIIKNGQLMQGVLESKGLASFKGKLLNEIDMLCGHKEAVDFLYNITRIILEFMIMKGFSISIDDVSVSKEANVKIKAEIKNLRKKTQKFIEDYKSGEIKGKYGLKPEELLEGKIIKEISDVTSKTQKIIEADAGENGAIIMARTGARGSLQNLIYMSAFLGQELVRGKRIFRGYENRTLPFFEKGDLSLEAHGFDSNSLKDGISYTNFFFEIMKGREGLMDSSLKTKVSGYMQRRLVNALQDFVVDKDKKVVGANGEIVQFIAGEDRIDPAKSNFGKPFKNREDSEYEDGEAIGIVSSQSISEPATQTTLRSYHAEGRLTLTTTKGLPRILELIDGRKEPKTPAMEIYLTKEYNNEKSAYAVASKIKEIKLIDILKEDTINAFDLAVELIINEKIAESFSIKIPEVMESIKKADKTVASVVKDNKIIVTYKKENKTIQDLHGLRVKLRDVYVGGIKLIKQVIIEKEGNDWKIKTLGSNLRKVLKIKGVDATRTICNNIFEVKRVLGIEAARNVIVNEIWSTMKEQGVKTNIRHLLLVADCMTYPGTIKSIGRAGLSGAKYSVLARANFEETVKNLTRASIIGETENFNGIVENLIVGSVVPIGTAKVKLKMKE